MYPFRNEMEVDENISINVFKISHTRITSYSVPYTLGFFM